MPRRDSDVGSGTTVGVNVADTDWVRRPKVVAENEKGFSATNQSPLGVSKSTGADPATAVNVSIEKVMDHVADWERRCVTPSRQNDFGSNTRLTSGMIAG
jgi:hypothetical protein